MLNRCEIFIKDQKEIFYLFHEISFLPLQKWWNHVSQLFSFFFEPYFPFHFTFLIKILVVPAFFFYRWYIFYVFPAVFTHEEVELKNYPKYMYSEKKGSKDIKNALSKVKPGHRIWKNTQRRRLDLTSRRLHSPFRELTSLENASYYSLIDNYLGLVRKCFTSSESISAKGFGFRRVLSDSQ